jgi:hypothetical protein
LAVLAAQIAELTGALQAVRQRIESMEAENKRS